MNRFLVITAAGLIWLLAAVSVSGSAASEGQGSINRLDGARISPAEIDATVERPMRAAEVTGVAITIFKGGRPAYVKTYGLRDKEKNLPLTPDTILSAASFTKVAFAYLVMQLVGEGALDLDKPVYQYLPKALPEYPAYADLAGDARYKKITARMLLSHTAGFPNFRWLNDDHKLNINFEPGTRYAYSGEGVELLQLIVETVTKKPLEELMQQRVFRPLGMTRTSMVWQAAFEDNFANGYDEYGRSLGPERRPDAAAAGSMQTTLNDFTRFMQAVIEGRGLTAKARELMLSPQISITSKHQFPTLENIATDQNKPIRLSYGLGWGLYWSPYGKAFFKEGHAEGFRNYTVIFDQPKTGIIIMTNSSSGEGIFQELLDALLKDTFTPIEWEGYTPYNLLPPRPPLKVHHEVSVAAPVLDRYVGRYGEPPNLILVVRREGDHLSIQENDEPPEDAFPESDTQFFSKNSDDEISFALDAQKRVTQMVIRTGGRNIPIKRID